MKKSIIRLLTTILAIIFISCCASACSIWGGSPNPDEGIPDDGTKPGDTTPDDGTKPDDTTPEEDDSAYVPKAEVLAVKGGADGIVVMMHDDGDYSSAVILDALYKEYGLRGDVALLASRVYDVYTESVNSADSAKWQALLDTGRWNIVSHSLTHDYNNSNGGGWLNDYENEVLKSQEVFRMIFPKQRVLTFAYPVYSSTTGIWGTSQWSDESKVFVGETYISGRGGSTVPTPVTGESDWKLISGQSMSQSNLDKILSYIDSSIANKELAIIYCHKVCEDTDTPPSQTVTKSYMRSICEKVASYTESGKAWGTFYEDAVLYLREAQSASVSVLGDVNGLSVTLSDTMDDDIYNYPLTVRISVPMSWAAVKITQNGKVGYAFAKDVNGNLVIDADIVPDGGAATVEPCLVSDIPTESEKSEDTPPATVESMDKTFDFEDGISDVYFTSSAVSNKASVSSGYIGGNASSALRFNKTGTGITPGFCLYGGNYPVKAAAASVSFKIYISPSAVSSSRLGYVRFSALRSNPYFVTILPDEDGFRMGDINSPSAPTVSNTLTSALAYGEWHDVRIDMRLTCAGGFLAEIYVGGVKVAESENLGNYSKVESPDVQTAFECFRFESPSSAILDVYFDDLTLKAGSREFVGISEEVAPVVGGSGATVSPTAGVTTFEEGDACEANVTNVSNTSAPGSITYKITDDPVKNGTNGKVLKVTTTSGYSVSGDKASYTKVANVTYSASDTEIEMASYAFETDIHVDMYAASTPICFIFRDSQGKVNYNCSLVISSDSDGEFGFSIRNNVLGRAYVVGASGAPFCKSGEWVNLKIVLYKYYDEAQSKVNCGAKFYVNGEWVADDTDVSKTASLGYDVSHVEIQHVLGTVPRSYYFDNISLTEKTDDGFFAGEIK